MHELCGLRGQKYKCNKLKNKVKSSIGLAFDKLKNLFINPDKPSLPMPTSIKQYCFCTGAKPRFYCHKFFLAC